MRKVITNDNNATDCNVRVGLAKRNLWSVISCLGRGKQQALGFELNFASFRLFLSNCVTCDKLNV